MPLPVTVIGTSRPIRACVPDAVPSAPVVVAGAEADEPSADEPEVGAVADDPVDDESPSTEMPLPDTVMGRATSGATWEPEAMPCAPVVVGDEVAVPAVGVAGSCGVLDPVEWLSPTH